MSIEPTTETIARMEARGWRWDAQHRRFAAADMLVFPCGRGWLWGRIQYGISGSHPTPDLAADEAEAWLRGVLAELRFPWLRVEP